MILNRILSMSNIFSEMCFVEVLTLRMSAFAGT